jgi:uncharacterized membrane protein
MEYSPTRMQQNRQMVDSTQRANDPARMTNVNVGKTERYLSLGAGLTLIVLALKAGDWRGLLLAALGGQMIYRGMTGHDAVYSALGLNTSVATNKHAVSVPHEQGVHVTASVTINRSQEDLYNYWRNLENLPMVMPHLERVEVLDDKRSRWTAKAPANIPVTWESEIHNEVPFDVIAWRSVGDSMIANAGAVRFKPAPAGRGTEVHVTFEYTPPAGNLGVTLAKLLGADPEMQTKQGLRRLKQMMEAGEIANNNGGHPRSS